MIFFATMKRLFFNLGALALGLPGRASAQSPASSPSLAQPPRAIEARTDQELKKMIEFLAKLPRLTKPLSVDIVV